MEDISIAKLDYCEQCWNVFDFVTSMFLKILINCFFNNLFNDS